MLFDDFVEAVRSMRQLQKEYFKAKTYQQRQEVLPKALAAESRVDDLIRHYDARKTQIEIDLD